MPAPPQRNKGLYNRQQDNSTALPHQRSALWCQDYLGREHGREQPMFHITDVNVIRLSNAAQRLQALLWIVFRLIRCSTGYKSLAGLFPLPRQTGKKTCYLLVVLSASNKCQPVHDPSKIHRLMANSGTLSQNQPVCFGILVREERSRFTSSLAALVILSELNWVLVITGLIAKYERLDLFASNQFPGYFGTSKIKVHKFINFCFKYLTL